MNKFDKVFSKYKQSDAARTVLDKVENIITKLDREHKIAEIYIKLPELVTKDKLYAIEDEIKEAYGLNLVRLLPKYSPELFDPRYIPEIMKELNRTGAVSRGFFNEYDYEIYEDKLDIKVSFSNGGVELLYCAKTNEIISNIIYGEFGIRFKVTLSEETSCDVNENYFSNQVGELERIARDQNYQAEKKSTKKETIVQNDEQNKYTDFSHITTLSQN